MAWNPRNAIVSIGDAIKRLLTFEEIAQGVLNADQDAIRVEQIVSSGVDSYTDGSGTITNPAASQQVFAANASRKYLFILNLSDTDMWINFGTAAVASQPSIKLVANGGFFAPRVVSDESVNIICASAGKAFVAKQA